MAKIFIDTEKLFDAYYCLSRFRENSEGVVEYQNSIKSSLSNAVNNAELETLLSEANGHLCCAIQTCDEVMSGLNEINSIAEWCNDETRKEVESLNTYSATSNGSQQNSAPILSSSQDFFLLLKTGIGIGKSISEIIDGEPALRVAKQTVKTSLGILSDLRIDKVYKDGKVLLSGYKKTDHLSWHYNKEAFINKQATNFSFIDKAKLIVSAGENVYDTGKAIYNTWKDDTKDTEEKVIDTIAYGYCSAASMALDVAAVVAGNAVVAAIPIPVVNVLVGSAVEFVVGTMAETMRSEKVVNQVIDSIEATVGAAKAGAEAVSSAYQDLKSSENAGEAIVNTAKLVGSAVVAGVEVVGTFVAEGIKTATTIITETAKNVATKVKNFFKGW